MDAATELVTVSAASARTTTKIHTSASDFNVNQSNNNIHTHVNTHSGRNSLTNKATSKVISNGNISNVGSSNGSSSNSNSSCSSSSTSSNSSGYGSTTTTPTNYDLQQTTPTTTPIPTTPVANAEHIIPVATVAAVTPFYNESITTHNLETHYAQQHHNHSQQQQHQQQQHHFLQTNHHQFTQNHLQTNLQQQHHQYLPRQQYYSPYDYQQTAPNHNLSGTPVTPTVAPYNVLISEPYELSSPDVTPSYNAGQYKSSSATGVTNYERSLGVKTHVAAPTYNQQQQQQPQKEEQQQQSNTRQQQTQHFTSILASSRQRSTSLISNSTNTNTTKPQAAATPFYANPTPFYENFKRKMPLEYHDTYSNSSTPTATTYQQQQKYYAAAKSQLQEASYGSANTGNLFAGPTAGLNLSANTFDKYMYPHTSATGYSTPAHLGNDTPTEVSNYRKPVMGNVMNSTSWPWGIDYTSGNSRCIPPPTSHLPTATVAPTHTTHLAQTPLGLARDPYFMGHEKYGVKYDKYNAPSYQQSYVSPPANRHIWPTPPHASNITQLNERQVLATGPPPALPAHGLHTTPCFPSNSTASLNSRQNCCSQPYQPQSCYYPPSHPVPPRLSHNQTPTLGPPAAGYLSAQQSLGQSPHLNALSASCKYGGVLPDYGNGNQVKTSNDLYLNNHHYDNNLAPHNFGYGSGHNSQQIYSSNPQQPITTHGITPTSLLTNSPLNANPTSFTNDLSLTTSNFDNYHTHLDTHPSQQPLSGLHNQASPPAYGPTVAKRALLDYRKPIQPQPQPPPTIAEDCYTTLTPRDHYNQQEFLNIPEATRSYGEYQAHQSDSTSLSTLAHTSAALTDSARARDESNKNLSLRDFIANWNDDEDEYQNNEEMNFDRNTVIGEVLQTTAVEQEVAAVSAAVAVEQAKVIKHTSLHFQDEGILKECVNPVESFTAKLNETESNQYVNLPDIVIDIEKSNNVNSSIVTPTTSPTPPPLDGVINTSLTLTNFDVEKELDELNLKKPALQELTKDLNDTKDFRNITISQLSPCKNLTNELSFEDLNLDPANKTVLNAITTGLTNTHSSQLSEQCFKDIEGYESSSSRHSNESAFEKEYETFINKINSESSTNKGVDEKTADADKEMDFVQNVREFSKFYKCKRKLKEDELKSSMPAKANIKKLKTSSATKVNSSNFPQAYTKKSRNRWNKSRLQSPHKRKPLSAYYKVIHAIRRFGLYRERRVREYMAELKEKHLPLIKRQSIKNYTHEIFESVFNANSLKALCITAINTEAFRESLILTTSADEPDDCFDSEEKHICIDPTCDTCEVIKSLMETENLETTLRQLANENNDENKNFATTIFCGDNNNETTTIFEDAPNTVDLNFQNEEHIVISTEMETAQYSQENQTAFDTKVLGKNSLNSTDLKPISNENVGNETDKQDCNKLETNIGSENWYEGSKLSNLDSQADELFEMSLQPAFETSANINLETSFLENDKFKVKECGDNISTCGELNYPKPPDAMETKLASQNNLFNDHTSEFAAGKQLEALKLFEQPSTEINITNQRNETKIRDPLSKEKCSAAKQYEESESDDSDSRESDSDSSSSDTDDSEDSYRKSSGNSESSDTDTEVQLDDEDETVNADSSQSYHKENVKTITPKQSSPSRESEKNDGDSEKEPEGLIKTEKRSPVNSCSDIEEESSSPQRIVIRITKSLSPNDQSLRVENVFGKSLKAQVEFNNQTESKTTAESLEKQKKSKVNPKQEYFLEECVSEKSVELPTGKKLKGDGVADKKLEINTAPLKLILRKQKSIEVPANIKSIEPLTEQESNSESEFEEDEILEKDSALDTSSKFSPRNKIQAFDIYGSYKKIESEMVPMILNTSAGKEETCLNQIMEKTLEEYSETTESEVVLKKMSEVNSTDLKLSLEAEDFPNEHASQTSLESRTETKLEDIVVDINSKMGDSKKAEILEKSVEPLVEVEFQYEDGPSKKKPKTIVTNLSSKAMQEDDKENNVFEENSKAKTEIENIKATQLQQKQFAELSPLPENVLSEYLAAEDVYQASKLIPKVDDTSDSIPSLRKIENTNSDSVSSSFEVRQMGNDIKEDSLCEKAAQTNTEVNNLTDSESEEEEEGELDNEIHSPNEDPGVKQSDSQNSYDSEYETDGSNESLEAKWPIKISDAKLTDICNHDEELKTILDTFSKTSEDALQEDKSVKEFNDSEEIAEDLIGADNETQQEFVGKISHNFNPSLDLEPVYDFKLTEQAKDEKEAATISPQSLVDIEFSVNGEDGQKINGSNFEEHLSDHSCSSADLSEGRADEALSDHKTQKGDERPDNSCKSQTSDDYILEQTRSEAYSHPNKSETIIEDSITIKGICENLQILPETVKQMENKIAETPSEEIEKSVTVLEAEEANISQNAIQEESIDDSDTQKPGTTKENSYTSEESNSPVDNFNEIVEDKTTESEESIILQDPKLPTQETCSIISDKKQNIHPVCIEGIVLNKTVVIEGPKMIENNVLEGGEATSTTKDADISSEAIIEEADLAGSNDVNDATEFLRSISSKNLEDVNCKNHAEALIEETENVEAPKDPKETITEPRPETSNTLSQLFIEHSQIAVDDINRPLKAVSKSNADIDSKRLEITTEAATEESSYMDEFINQDGLERVSQQNETRAEMTIKESETIFKEAIEDSRRRTPTDSLDESKENVSKTAAEKLEDNIENEEEDIFDCNATNIEETISETPSRDLNETHTRVETEKGVTASKAITEESKPTKEFTYQNSTISEEASRTAEEFEVTSQVSNISIEVNNAENLDETIDKAKSDLADIIETDEFDSQSKANMTQDSVIKFFAESLTQDLKNSSKKLNVLQEEEIEAFGSDAEDFGADDLSKEFLGFKNQSSFEDESEDFHGFEDLEEVTRIRQEIENLNDDSAANDGFPNYLTLSNHKHTSSKCSSSESSSSEINELKALEKELSQHQPELQVDDEDKETEQDMPTKTVEMVSSNDIQHIKQMLESDEEQQSEGQGEKIMLEQNRCKDKSVGNSKNISNLIISSVNSTIPKLSDLCRAALNSSLNSNSNLAQPHTETSAQFVERELSVEEALAEMYRQAGVLLSDPEDCDNEIPSPGNNEAPDVLMINLQEILNSDNNEVYVLQCDMNENVLNVVQSAEEHEEEHQDNNVQNTERVNTVQIILDTQNPEPQIHIISSDSESEVIILSDDDSDFSYRMLTARQDHVAIPFINDDDITDSDSLFDISTIHHEEIVPDNLNKFLQEEFYKYLHEKYVQRNISKYYHANRVLKKYKKRFVRTFRQ